MIETLQLSWHIVRRNWAVYRKDLLANTSPTVADPAFILLSLGLGLGPLVQSIDGLTYPQFLAPGLIGATALFTSFFESSYGFYIRLTYENVFQAMLTTPIGVREVVVGEFVWLFLKGAMMAAGVGVVLAVFGLIPDLRVLPLLPLLGGLIALPCGALGLVAAGYVRNINQFQTVYSFLIAPMYFLSGGFFPVFSHPVLSKVLLLSPFHHGVRLLQITVWKRGTSGEVLLHLGALIFFSLVLGIWAARRVRAKLIA